MNGSKILYILRHGESEHFSKDHTDIHRKLTANGQKRLERLLQTFKNQKPKIDLIICSDAVRTKETAELVKRYLDIGELIYSNEIYEAEVEIILQKCLLVPEEVDQLMLIGHNPGLSYLLAMLTGENFLNMQPGMLAKVELNIDKWGHLGRNSGILLEIFE